jgi:hypothetical protein
MICKEVQRWMIVSLMLIMSLLVGAQMVRAEAPTTPVIVPISVKEVTGKLALYSTITVEVENLSEYLKTSGKDAKKFMLYIDWRPLKGVNARSIDCTNKVQFDIERTAATKNEWAALLGRPFTKGFTYKVPVSIGYENEKPIPSDIVANLVVIDKTLFWIFLALFTLFLILFLWLAKASSIIRDPGSELPCRQRTYSLGRTQMAFWFFVVSVSFFLIWVITSDRESLTESALELIGISASTALGAGVVGFSKRNAAESKRKDLEIERATIETMLNELGPQTTASPQPTNLSDLKKEEAEKKARLDQVKKEIQDLTATSAPQKSEGFLNDILTDADGISLHRFQMFIWTIVLGIIFVASVYNSLAMPEFSGTLLALMGISSGTYIGFKFPEKQT